MLFDMLQVYVNNASSTVKVRKESFFFFLQFFPSLSMHVQVLYSHVHMGVYVSHTYVYVFKIYTFSVIPYNLKNNAGYGFWATQICSIHRRM